LIVKKTNKQKNREGQALPLREMQENKNKYPVRKPTRLKEYDYSNNAYYFITICVDNKKEVFGTVKNNSMSLNEYGILVEKSLFDLTDRFSFVQIDYYVIMPNHFHCIFILENETNKNKKSISEIIGAFKSITTIKLHKIGLIDFKWQRSFYDRIIRNEKELLNIRRYIEQNPLRWELEKHNPENLEL
jgi:REP element-mobilizing transposase RayT